MLKNLFRKQEYITVSSKPLDDKEFTPNIPNGKWVNCKKCKSIIYLEDLENDYHVCPTCNYHFNISSDERVKQIFDKGSFSPMFEEIEATNPLDFPGYEEKLNKVKEKSNLSEGVLCGTGNIDSKKVVAAIMDSEFLMGSMGCAVGERITRTVEYATANKLPLIIFTASGGARMQEGILSLMQMAKTSAAIAKHDEAGLLYISVITNPTTGGVTASFAMLGDVIIAEPGATLGFAGRRVIENTINQKLPDDFQSAEFMLEKGFVDDIVSRKELKSYLSKLLRLHGIAQEK
ncbi:MAG: acetyl-CoA carboxylase, carboxyltransferase subunit beta [Intestinibacter sp.]